MTSNDPDQIREQIERTRAGLSQDVNALADSVNPASVAKRQTAKVRGAVFGVKDRVMGSASDAGASLSSAQSTLTETVTSAPAQVQARTAGNPLAAGLVAFGVGWLVSSLLPATAAEQRAAAKVKETAAPMLSDAAKEVADHLKEPAQQAVESVKGTAAEAAGTVREESTSAAQDVKDQAQDAKETVQQHNS